MSRRRGPRPGLTPRSARNRFESSGYLRRVGWSEVVSHPLGCLCAFDHCSAAAASRVPLNVRVEQEDDAAA